MKRCCIVITLAILFLKVETTVAQEGSVRIIHATPKRAVLVKDAPVNSRDRGVALSPMIRVEPDSLSFMLPRFVWTSKDFYIHNNGDQPLTVSITDLETTAFRSTAYAVPHYSAAAMVKRLKKQLDKVQSVQSELIPHGVSSLSPALGSQTIVINDPAGDVTNPGIDVVSVDIAQNAFFYTFTINFVAAPDSNSLPVLSLDLDQNFGTGAFPSPLGFGPGFFDVGSEYDVVFDVGNLLGDSLGLSASAYVIAGGDTTFTPVGVSLPLSIGSNSVQAQFVKLLTPMLVDDNLNAGLVCLSLLSSEFPDFAPDYGHGLLGQESGLSWLTELDSSGFSAIPLDATIPPGDSLLVQAKMLSVNPNGDYSAEIRIANNSVNNPNLVLLVSISIMGISNPAIQVSPVQIADTLAENQSPKQYDLTIANTGTGNLVYLVSDSLPPGQSWLNLPAIPFGQVGGGESDVITIEVDPSGLPANQSYSGFVVITSNDAVNPQALVPVDIYIQGSTGVERVGGLPQDFALYPNFPNPFNPVTNLGFRITDFGLVNLEVFDLMGRKIATLVNKDLTPGNYKVQWDGRNEAGELVGSGIYFYRLTTGTHNAIRKMILLK